MDIENYKTLSEFCNKINKTYKTFRFSPTANCIGIIAKYDVAIVILNYLVKQYDFKLINIDIADKLADGYDDAYIISLDVDGGLWAQKAKYKDDSEYDYIDCLGYDIVFVHLDINSKFILKNESNKNCIGFDIDDNDFYKRFIFRYAL